MLLDLKFDFKKWSVSSTSEIGLVINVGDELYAIKVLKCNRA